MKHLLALSLALCLPMLAQQFPGGGAGGGVGVGAANLTSEQSGPVTTAPLDITTLGLTTATQNTLIVQCYTGTGFASGHVTGPLTPLAVTSLNPRSLTSVTANFASSSNVACAANSNGGAGATGPAGATGGAGAAGATPWTPPAAWSSATAYTAGPPASLVTYQGQAYVAIASSTNVTPGTDPTKWTLVAARPGRSVGPTAFTCATSPCTLTINHALGTTGAILFMQDSTGLNVEGAWKNTDANNISVTFATPQSGTYTVIGPDVYALPGGGSASITGLTSNGGAIHATLPINVDSTISAINTPESPTALSQQAIVDSIARAVAKNTGVHLAIPGPYPLITTTGTEQLLFPQAMSFTCAPGAYLQPAANTPNTVDIVRFYGASTNNRSLRVRGCDIKPIYGPIIAITVATNTTPIVITAASCPATGAIIQVDSVGGLTAANGVWTVTNVDATHCSLNGSAGNGAYTSGGTFKTVPGRHGYNIDTTDNFISDAIFSDFHVDQLGGKAVYSTNPTLTDGFFSTTFEHFTLYGGISLNRSGDSLRFRNGAITGLGPAIYLDSLSGAAANSFQDLNITSSGNTVVGTTPIIVAHAITPNFHKVFVEATSSGNPATVAVQLVGDAGRKVTGAVFDHFVTNFASTSTATGAILASYVTGVTITNESLLQCGAGGTAITTTAGQGGGALTVGLDTQYGGGCTSRVIDGGGMLNGFFWNGTTLVFYINGIPYQTLAPGGVYTTGYSASLSMNPLPGGMRIIPTSGYCWNEASDACIYRPAANTFAFGNGTANDASATLKVGTILGTKLADPYTVGTGGVTANTLVGKDSSAPSKVVTPGSGGCGFGVALSTVAAAGTVNVQWSGIATLVADNAVTAGDMIVGGTSTPGYGRDSLQTGRSGISSSTCVIGFAQSSAITGATFTVLLTGPGDYGTGAAGATGDVQIKAAGGGLTSGGINDTGTAINITGRTLSVGSGVAMDPSTGIGTATKIGNVALSGLSGITKLTAGVPSVATLGDMPLPTVTVSTSGPVTVGTTPGFYFNNASGALTYNLPTITSGLVGLQVCFRDAVTRTGAITLQLPASTQMDCSGQCSTALGTSAGTLVSTGVTGDATCVVAQSTTVYVAYISSGTWSNN